jgi:hypothetical protein
MCLRIFITPSALSSARVAPVSAHVADRRDLEPRGPILAMRPFATRDVGLKYQKRMVQPGATEIQEDTIVDAQPDTGDDGIER